MISDTRRNMKVGNSIAVSLPAALEKGANSTMACNRLVLLDPRGQIPPSELLAFLEEVVERRLWAWLKRAEGRT